MIILKVLSKLIYTLNVFPIKFLKWLVVNPQTYGNEKEEGHLNNSWVREDIQCIIISYIEYIVDEKIILVEATRMKDL